MKNLTIRGFVKLQTLRLSCKDEQGQDLIEYALVVALIAFAATVGMDAVANKINTAFGLIGNKLTNAIGT